jgi:hypothetical protein
MTGGTTPEIVYDRIIKIKGNYSCTKAFANIEIKINNYLLSIVRDILKHPKATEQIKNHFVTNLFTTKKEIDYTLLKNINIDYFKTFVTDLSIYTELIRFINLCELQKNNPKLYEEHMELETDEKTLQLLLNAPSTKDLPNLPDFKILSLKNTCLKDIPADIAKVTSWKNKQNKSKIEFIEKAEKFQKLVLQNTLYIKQRELENKKICDEYITMVSRALAEGTAVAAYLPNVPKTPVAN